MSGYEWLTFAGSFVVNFTLSYFVIGPWAWRRWQKRTRKCAWLGCPGRVHCLTDVGYGLLCHDENIHQASRERMLKP